VQPFKRQNTGLSVAKVPNTLVPGAQAHQCELVRHVQVMTSLGGISAIHVPISFRPVIGTKQSDNYRPILINGFPPI